jgi:hypothetical protein
LRTFSIAVDSGPKISALIVFYHFNFLKIKQMMDGFTGEIQLHLIGYGCIIVKIIIDSSIKVGAKLKEQLFLSK